MALTPRFPVFLHGGDYNPDQWLKYPEILEEDVRLMVKAHVNCVSLAIFAWAALEPEEGVYRFEWLDQVIDRLWKNGIRVILATPSGARPAWMAQKYPEVLRTNSRYEKQHFGGRHNHCASSPVYRRKVTEMDWALAARYANHPAVILWHISNEFSGECHCELCQQRFRTWLKEKYGTLDKLNDSWWTGFWSQRYTDWDQIEGPSPNGQMANLGMQLDWRRFSTWACKDFIEMEKAAVHTVAPELPVTANLMESFRDYDYFNLSECIDVVSWDAYPAWRGDEKDIPLAAEFAMNHDMMRSYKDQNFLLMESTPSLVNWKPVNKLKKPGMHLLSSLQAVAHGSESVCYFQWRKGRGGVEMFHGAVVDHDGRDDTRTFADVTGVGRALEKLQSAIYDVPTRRAEVCILFDWDNRWALEFVEAAQNHNMQYIETVRMHYRALWQRGIRVDFRDMRDCTDLSGYKLVIAPLLFMTRNGIESKLRAFVENGGTLVTTYFSGVVDGNDLAHLGNVPHDLTDVLGLRATELDSLWPDEHNAMQLPDGRSWPVGELCQLIAAEGAEVRATYASDFYAGRPCLTRNAFGQGEAWYLAAKLEQSGLDAFYADLCTGMKLHTALDETLPEGVVATERSNTAFLQNYSGKDQSLRLRGSYTDLLTDRQVTGPVVLPAYGIMVLKPEV